jgi:hypothetical protein
MLALAVVMSVLIVRAPSAYAADIYVTPTAGSQYDTFVFQGVGFNPGDTLTESYTSPDGTTYTYYINGAPAVIVVGDDGTFTVSVNPATDFSGASAGRWAVRFCLSDGSNCWSGTIDISV